MFEPTHRKIRGFALDPTFSTTLAYHLTNEVVYKVRWENDIQPGPIGEYLEVVDYDPMKQCMYEAANLNEAGVLNEQGYPLSEADPKFHQQQVYAVVMTTIETFEKALSRKIIFTKRDPNYNNGSSQFIKRLRIYPHALYQQNAYYSPDKIALLFGYFRAGGSWTANNIPNSTVFTCLSPDIVAHESTHAMLHSLLPFLNHDTNPDMLAFHEGFADIIALLQRFSFRSLVKQQITNSRGDLYSPANMLGSLGFQFGQATSSNRQALRSYLVQQDKQGNYSMVKSDPTKYQESDEAHDRGAILVAIVFDAFARLYNYNVADLLRLASNGSGILAPGAISPDLADRLSTEACSIASKLSLICIRALDYCPPTDMTFGDYLRALITADVEYNPDDHGGLRYALLEAFKAWGVLPVNLTTFSVQSLLWSKIDDYYANDTNSLPMVDALKSSFKFILDTQENNQLKRDPISLRQRLEIKNAIERILSENDRQNIFDATQVLGMQMHQLFDRKFGLYYKGMEKLLGMCFDPINYEWVDDETKQTVKLKAQARDKFQVYNCRPFIRGKADGTGSTKQILISFLQKVFVDLKGSLYEGYFDNDQYAFRGGATVVVDLATYDINYAIVKSVSSSNRLRNQLDYALAHQAANGNSALLMQGDEPFAALHLH